MVWPAPLPFKFGKTLQLCLCCFQFLVEKNMPFSTGSSGCSKTWWCRYPQFLACLPGGPVGQGYEMSCIYLTLPCWKWVIPHWFRVPSSQPSPLPEWCPAGGARPLPTALLWGSHWGCLDLNFEHEKLGKITLITGCYTLSLDTHYCLHFWRLCWRKFVGRCFWWGRITSLRRLGRAEWWAHKNIYK